jgi:anti-sigma regulatory factor (Ser/Thr protein kinase)
MTEGTQRLTLPPPAGCLAELRGWARSWMDHHPTAGVDPDRVLLSLTELVTNTIRHATGPVDIELAGDKERLRLDVRDHSDELPHQRAACADAEGGRGMIVLASQATRWGVSRLPAGGKTVWCEFASD